jgi:predicted RNase H-like HicB family nuclease
MVSYTFRVNLEPDDEGWRAFYPPLERIGASTWGKSREEAIRNLEEVLSMIVEEFKEEGRPLPETGHMTVSEGAAVTVNV